jgi:hypothetical protein
MNLTYFTQHSGTHQWSAGKTIILCKQKIDGVSFEDIVKLKKEKSAQNLTCMQKKIYVLLRTAVKILNLRSQR